MRLIPYVAGSLGVFILIAGLCRADDAILTPRKKQHWAWKAPVRPSVPVVMNQGWIKNPIDAFILDHLEKEGLQPAAFASREQLIRRVTFDLIGLPPTPEEIDAFVNDSAPRAWEKVIDRLLASPHYGERWGRHWLDLARFAESNGYEFDEIRPDAWRYRDYVIRSFNQDKPYDRFILEQLAGDELFPDDADALIATGFNLLGPDMTDSSNQAQRRQNTLDDMTETAGLAFLGMTIGCARCHDHKFEPILQADFFRMQAFFAPAGFRKDMPVGTKAELTDFHKAQEKYQALIGPWTSKLAALEEPYRKAIFETKLARVADEARQAHLTAPGQRTARQQELVDKTTRLVVFSTKDVLAAMPADVVKQHQVLQAGIKKFDSFKPRPLPVAMALQDKKEDLPKTFILHRGELNQPGEEVLPTWPVILSPDFKETAVTIVPVPTSTGRRATLAKWVASADHPLTARVQVNRLWQHHFGRGIVPTASDFGVRGEPPTHPELLDWLASEFTAVSGDAEALRSGAGPWTIKRMHKLMLLSATYQQSTLAGPQALEKDPDNQLFSRMNRLRLEGEIIRDSLLAVSGRLNKKMGGPGVFPPLPPEVQQAAKDWKTSPDPKDHVRRSLYIFAKRNLRFPFLESFDLPDSNLSCPKREQSTTAPQALALLNSSDVIAAAKAIAQRVEYQTLAIPDRITLVYRFALGRRPTENEMRLARGFLQESPLSELCRALFNVNEFVYLD